MDAVYVALARQRSCPLITCNPQLAHRALVADPSVATLLPCNVVVRTENGRTVIEALDPTMMATSGVPELAEVADDAKHRIEIALEALAGA